MGVWLGSPQLRNLDPLGMHVTEIELEDISAMCVVAKDGPSGARAAFDELESKLPSLRGRKFYGTYHDGEYRACVAMNEGDAPHAMKLITWVIPGGRVSSREGR
jgi:hypothetical protein